MFKNVIISLILLSVFLIICIGLGDAITPLFISFALAYFLFPLIQRLEKKGFSRKKSVVLTFSLIFIFFIAASILIVPPVIKETKEFLGHLPQATTKAIQNIESIASSFGYEVDLSKQGVIEYISDNIKSVSTVTFKSIGGHVKSAFGGITNWILGILNIILIPLFFIYVINDYEKIAREFKSYIPLYLHKRLEKYSSLINKVLSGYIRGQFSVAIILSVLYSIGLTLVGVKFGLVIGLIAGLVSIIPYVGFIFGFGAALAVTLANFQLPVFIGLIVVFVIIQLLESFIITPKLVGNKVGLSELSTMLALIIGGNLLGLVGMLLAIPIAAILKYVLIDLKKDYQASTVYTG